jgi:tripartite-type tricarboxylate transporter receptor subunit TctC
MMSEFEGKRLLSWGDVVVGRCVSWFIGERPVNRVQDMKSAPRKAPTRLRIFIVTAAMCPVLAIAQAFPTKPIRMIVAYPPGGGTDIVARIIAPKLAIALGQQVVIENRGGAGGIIGTDLAAKSPPDGYTWFLGGAGNLAVNQALYSKVPFDVAKDFAAITQVVSVDVLLTVHPSLPVKTVSELIALEKAKKGELNYATSGTGGIPHLAMELLNISARTKFVHIAYKGGAPALIDILGGHIPMLPQSVVQAMPHVKQGKLRAIALFSPKRATLLPDVPTVSETLPNCVATNWFGLVVPAKTPTAIQKRIYEETVKILRVPETRDSINEQGVVVVGDSPEEFSAFMKSEFAKWFEVIKTLNIRAE